MSRNGLFRPVRTPDYYYNKGKAHQSQLKQRGITKPLWECIADVRAADKATENVLNGAISAMGRFKLK